MGTINTVIKKLTSVFNRKVKYQAEIENKFIIFACKKCGESGFTGRHNENGTLKIVCLHCGEEFESPELRTKPNYKMNL